MFFAIGLSFVLSGSTIAIDGIENVKGKVLGMSEEIKDISLFHLPRVLQA